MVPPPFAAEPGHWFLRGVQSAAFYYLSCTPWVEFKHKRKRRKEAQEQAHERGEVIVNQPGLIRQPAPFQTNEAWAEELILGPGPPKGWKKDTLLQKLQSKVLPGQHEQGLTQPTHQHEVPALQLHPTASSARPSTRSTDPPAASSTSPSFTTNETEERIPAIVPSAPGLVRPPLERRLSNAMENIKESFRASLHPPKWNWKRYDREDEILAGFTERVTRIWNRATSNTNPEDAIDQQAGGESSTHKRRRAHTNESERYDYNRVRHPEVNDMHPPIVSQLPATRAEVAWMLLPPPSAAVMEARTRPAAEPEMRWPLCVIGKPPKDPNPNPLLAKTRSTEQVGFPFPHRSDLNDDAQSSESVEDVSEEEESVQTPKARVENRETTRIKHLSDPIIRPPPIHPVSRFAGDLFVPKRRDSWQFHYFMPSPPVDGAVMQID